MSVGVRQIIIFLEVNVYCFKIYFLKQTHYFASEHTYSINNAQMSYRGLF